MNEISLHNFNTELQKLAANTIKEAGNSYNLKIPKKAVGKLGWTGLGIGLGAAGMDAVTDWNTGRAIRKQQSF